MGTHRPKPIKGIRALKKPAVLQRVDEVNKRVDAILRANAKRVRAKKKAVRTGERIPSAFRDADRTNSVVDSILRNPDLVPSGLVKKKNKKGKQRKWFLWMKKF